MGAGIGTRVVEGVDAVEAEAEVEVRAGVSQKWEQESNLFESE